MKKVLVIEIDITDIKESWVICIQKAQMETGQEIEKQVVLKRTSKEKVMCVPEVGHNNFVLKVTEEIWDDDIAA